MIAFPPWAAPAAAIILIGAGFWGGYSLRSVQATSDTLRAEKAAHAAEIALREVIADKSALYEQARAELDARKVTATSTIREIYRDVPPPPAICAAPDSARGLLIDLGATGPVPARSEPSR